MLVVFEKGNIVRSRVDEVRLTGRNTMGVQFAKPGKNDAIVAVTRNPEKEVEEAVEAAEEAAGLEGEAPAEVAAADGDALAPAESEGADVADETTDAVPSDEEIDRGGRE